MDFRLPGKDLNTMNNLVRYRREAFGWVVYDSRGDKFWRQEGAGKKALLRKENSVEAYGDAISDDDASRLTGPLSVGWQITHRCNANCSHCYTDASPEGFYGVPRQILLAIADSICSSGTMRVDLCGGEPILRRDFGDIVALLAERKCAVVVSTNGSSPHQVAEHLGNIAALQISVDSFDPNEHDTFRGLSGLWEKATSCARLFSDHVFVRVFTVLTKWNAKNVERISQLVATLGASEHQYLRFVPAGRGSSSREAHALDDTEYASALERIAAIGDSLRGNCVVECIDQRHYPQSTVTVSPHGELVSGGEALGNLQQQELSSLWADGRLNKVGHLRMWTDGNYF